MNENVNQTNYGLLKETNFATVFCKHGYMILILYCTRLIMEVSQKLLRGL